MSGRKRIPRELRRLVKEFYNNECAFCRDKNFLQIHHIDHNPENNLFENLILFCIWCHIEHHPENVDAMLNWLMKNIDKVDKFI